jgi:hypothetical protein
MALQAAVLAILAVLPHALGHGWLQVSFATTGFALKSA